MITVIYDPLHSTGVPDGLTMSVADAIIQLPQGETVTVGTGLVIDAIRVLVKKGKCAPDRINIIFNGISLTLNEHGKFNEPWPEGFNDTMEKYLIQLTKSP